MIPINIVVKHHVHMYIAGSLMTYMHDGAVIICL